MEELIEALRARLSTSLKNSYAIDEAALREAVAETADIVGNRIVPKYAQLDIGVYRYKTTTKQPPSESDQKLYDGAIKTVRSIPLINPDPLDPLSSQGSIVVDARGSDWE